MRSDEERQRTKKESSTGSSENMCEEREKGLTICFTALGMVCTYRETLWYTARHSKLNDRSLDRSGMHGRTPAKMDSLMGSTGH